MNIEQTKRWYKQLMKDEKRLKEKNLVLLKSSKQRLKDVRKTAKKDEKCL